ncbi:unnamed protein product [Sphenostylis stenocarpa]|uniref:Uncharacterized protein n=1 Tax=Sphenostylis stenocarpa TaxID=92480 RepID=A0AA86W5C7_9FABA|nr:unnamed protein product [Sphenostylis stenocarpa]
MTLEEDFAVPQKACMEHVNVYLLDSVCVFTHHFCLRRDVKATTHTLPLAHNQCMIDSCSEFDLCGVKQRGSVWGLNLQRMSSISRPLAMQRRKSKSE